MGRRLDKVGGRILGVSGRSGGVMGRSGPPEKRVCGIFEVTFDIKWFEEGGSSIRGGVMGAGVRG